MVKFQTGPKFDLRVYKVSKSLEKCQLLIAVNKTPRRTSNHFERNSLNHALLKCLTGPRFFSSIHFVRPGPQWLPLQKYKVPLEHSLCVTSFLKVTSAETQA